MTSLYQSPWINAHVYVTLNAKVKNYSQFPGLNNSLILPSICMDNHKVIILISGLPFAKMFC